MPLSDLKNTKDTTTTTFLVAGALCILCALIVSTAAVGLKNLQDANVDLDRKRNLLKVTGFSDEDVSRNALKIFDEKFEAIIIDMDTGNPAPKECYAALTSAGKKFSEEEMLKMYDPVWASKRADDALSTKVERTDDKIKIKRREKYSFVYMLKNDDGSVKNYVFPVRGYGLWSMMYGYLAVKPDLQTVVGITFYEQAETPGLGGEIKSQRFVVQWPEKQIYDGEDVRLAVVKNGQKDDYTIDALSGATITSNGVTNLIDFWMGPKGFKPFIDLQKSKSSSAANTVETDATVTVVETGENHG